METPDLFATFLLNWVKKALREVLAETKPLPSPVMEDKVDRVEALEILNTSTPTLIKWEKEGRVKRYGTARKPYYFRSELWEVVRTMRNHKPSNQ